VTRPSPSSLVRSVAPYVLGLLALVALIVATLGISYGIHFAASIVLLAFTLVVLIPETVRLA